MTFRGEVGLFLFFTALIGNVGIVWWVAWKVIKKTDQIDKETKKLKHE